MGSRTSLRPRVSVILAVLNPDPCYFPLAVRSILMQTFVDFELLVVEDPGARKARDILVAFPDRRIRHIENERPSCLVDQKNQGVALARGELVAFMDADDIAEPHRLALQVKLFEQRPELDVLGSQITLIDATGAVIGRRLFPLGHDQLVTAMRRLVPISHPTIMLRRDVLVGAGGYQMREYAAAADYELWSRLVHHGARFANHPEALLRYRLHPDQMKATHLRETIRGVLYVKRRYWRRHMSWRDGLHMLGEQCLLGLPPAVVLRLLLWALYRDRAPAPPSQTPPQHELDRVAVEAGPIVEVNETAANCLLAAVADQGAGE